jgi:hypothetical protein
MTGDELGKTIVSAYQAFYETRPSAGAVTQSALDLTSLDGITASVDNLAAALLAGLTDPRANAKVIYGVERALTKVQRYYDSDYVDLMDLAMLLWQNCSVESVKTAARGVMETFQPGAANGLVLASQSLGDSVSQSNGVSIYFPLNGPISPAYPGLEMSQAIRWCDFLQTYLKP